MKRRTLEVDHWRHFMPLAPDIELQVESGAVTYHSLPNDVIIQGAREPSTHESPSIDLTKIPLQRGWRLTFVPITLPIEGDVKATIDGFRYEIREQYNGPDCFNYILTNGTQESNIATVKLTVVQGYAYDIALRHKYNDAYEFEMMGLKPTELPIPEHQLFRWYLTYPRVVKNEKLNRKQVEYKRKMIGYYQIGGYYDSDNKYKYVVESNPVKISQAFPDDIACAGFPIGDTDKIYEPTGDRGRVEIEVVFFFGELLRSESRRFTVTPESIYGRRWWESGNREGQVAPPPEVTLASTTDLNSTESINTLMTAVESNVEGAVPNQYARMMLNELGSAVGASNGAELTIVLNTANTVEGDYTALLKSLEANNVLETLESLQE